MVNPIIFADLLKKTTMSDMKDLVAYFPKQLREALEISEQSDMDVPEVEILNVLITGLGGSGIGGTIVSEIVAQDCPVSITVNKDYFLPLFVDKFTLVIVCSYSGNTEETLQAMDEALKKKAVVACISSGGKVIEKAKELNLPHIIIPAGNPPRASLGYSLTQLFYILNQFGLISDKYKEEINAGIELIEKEEQTIRQEAKEAAQFLYKKIPVIYAVDGFAGVATRFRQQINENSKMLCWHHILPEMNHNELVGWAEKHDECAVVILRNKEDYSRTQTRIEISKEVFSKYTSSIREIWSKGNSQLERSIYLIHLTDWISVELADMKHIDATEVNIINHLKVELSKI
jgi:glucose/mannose-6-phosphate isomerase